jgi:GTPase involved in cell partitioning and DNA repair
VSAGQGSFRDGGDGSDLYIRVPVGTIIRKKDAEVTTTTSSSSRCMTQPCSSDSSRDGSEQGWRVGESGISLHQPSQRKGSSCQQMNALAAHKVQQSGAGLSSSSRLVLRYLYLRIARC